MKPTRQIHLWFRIVRVMRYNNHEVAMDSDRLIHLWGAFGAFLLAVIFTLSALALVAGGEILVGLVIALPACVLWLSFAIDARRLWELERERFREF